METMRFRETRKKSYKLQISLLVTFLILGTAVIIFAMANEEEPITIGANQSDIENKKKIEQDALVNIYEEKNDNQNKDVDFNNLYTITEKTLSDKTNKKIKANISSPVIKIGDQEITALNDEIYKGFSDTFSAFKDTMSDVDNSFTYKVSYNIYNNIINKKKIISIVIYERMEDDSNKKTSMEKIHVYNIDLDSKKVLNQEDITADILGSKYKDIIKNSIKKFVLEKKYISEEKYNYAYTELEVFYIKENKLHLVFNPGDLVDKSKGIVDIIMEEN